MTKAEFEKQYLQTPEPIKCAVKDSKGNNCPGTPKNKISLDDKDEVWFCDACFKNYKNGAYKGI